MICKACNKDMPEDSVFCPFCASPIASEESLATETVETAPEAITEETNVSPVVPAEAVPTPAEASCNATGEADSVPEEKDLKAEASKEPKKRFCKHCGGLIDNDTRKCDKCGKQYFKIKRLSVPTIITAALLLCSLAGNIYQFNKAKVDAAKAAAEYEYKREASSKLYSDLLTRYNNNLELQYRLDAEYEFYRSCMFCFNPGSNLYHAHDCPFLDKSQIKLVFWSDVGYRQRCQYCTDWCFD